MEDIRMNKAKPKKKVDSSAHLRSHPSLDHKRTLDGQKLFDYKHWKMVRDHMKPTTFNYMSPQHGVKITDMVKVAGGYKQRFSRNNMVAQIPSNDAYSTFCIFTESAEFVELPELFDRQEEWIKTTWAFHMKQFKVQKYYQK
jgi:hypothetical protein